jgi:hypothetical protein
MIGTTVGHDRIVDKIDEGWMGEVYETPDERPHHFMLAGRDLSIRHHR